jgi:hypothetical protein
MFTQITELSKEIGKNMRDILRILNDACNHIDRVFCDIDIPGNRKYCGDLSPGSVASTVKSIKDKRASFISKLSQIIGDSHTELTIRILSSHNGPCPANHQKYENACKRLIGLHDIYTRICFGDGFSLYAAQCERRRLSKLLRDGISVALADQMNDFD